MEILNELLNAVSQRNINCKSKIRKIIESEKIFKKLNRKASN